MGESGSKERARTHSPLPSASEDLQPPAKIRVVSAHPSPSQVRNIPSPSMAAPAAGVQPMPPLSLTARRDPFVRIDESSQEDTTINSTRWERIHSNSRCSSSETESAALRPRRVTFADHVPTRNSNHGSSTSSKNSSKTKAANPSPAPLPITNEAARALQRLSSGGVTGIVLGMDRATPRVALHGQAYGEIGRAASRVFVAGGEQRFLLHRVTAGVVLVTLSAPSGPQWRPRQPGAATPCAIARRAVAAHAAAAGVNIILETETADPAAITEEMLANSAAQAKVSSSSSAADSPNAQSRAAHARG